MSHGGPIHLTLLQSCPRRDAEASVRVRSRVLAPWQRAREGGQAPDRSRTLFKFPGTSRAVEVRCGVGIRAGRPAFMIGKEIPSFPQRWSTLILSGQSTKPCTARVSTRSQRSLDDRRALVHNRTDRSAQLPMQCKYYYVDESRLRTYGTEIIFFHRRFSWGSNCSSSLPSTVACFCLPRRDMPTT